MNDIKKLEQVIPIGKQEYAYQCENTSHIFRLEAFVPLGGGKEPYPNTEVKEVWKYDFELQRHTGNSFIVTLRKFRNDHQVELFTTTMSFSQFVNQVFRQTECNVFFEHR